VTAGVVEEELAGAREIVEAETHADPQWRKLKMSWRLMRPRCERVEGSIIEHIFVKNILAHLRHRTL
jgi:hypothetical protein